MKCPYCEREMKKGYFIDREAPIQWIPEGSKPGLFKGSLAEGAVQLGGGSFWKNYSATAWYCPACKIVTVPVETDS